MPFLSFECLNECNLSEKLRLFYREELFNFVGNAEDTSRRSILKCKPHVDLSVGLWGPARGPARGRCWWWDALCLDGRSQRICLTTASTSPVLSYSTNCISEPTTCSLTFPRWVSYTHTHTHTHFHFSGNGFTFDHKQEVGIFPVKTFFNFLHVAAPGSVDLLSI